ncbi:MAG: hypothetical protein LRZ85_07240 [Alphaproteobacteria bacterium]|nr:hypothetical protein [Alphaproteobacteria bacterium]MCD8570581.1 hypothetical protein [Alphaproteobacteria bacterium]
MNAIKQALERLNASIDTLEFNVDYTMANKPGQQGDMFSSAPAVPASASNQNNVVIAQRLDNAIDAVEKLLKGKGA